MSYPNTFQSPDGKGSAIHPLLLALYYTSPSLVKAVANSNTDDKTLSHAVKKAWGSLGSENSAKAVWDLIGEAMLVPADSAELFNQLNDLFDAELADASANAMGIKSKMIIEAGARVKEGPVTNTYNIALSIPLRQDVEGETLQSLLQSNYASEKIDYMFPDDVEPVDAQKTNRITGKFREGVVFHLQRYKYDFNLMANAKIYDRVQFPDHLSGKEFAPFADPETAKSITGCSLDLVAVVTHSDEAGYGLLLRPDAKGPWWKCYDPSSPVPVESSIESAFGGEIDQDIGYMLFYRVTGGESALGSLARKMSRLSIKGTAAGSAPDPKAALPPSPTAKQAKAESGGGCCTVQ